MPLMRNPMCPGTCKILAWPHANNAGILLGCVEYPEDVSNKRQ